MRAVILATLVATAGTAAANPPAIATDQPARPRTYVTLEATALFSFETAQNEATYDHLGDYGFAGDPAGGLSAAAGYELIPFVDAGAVVDYWSRFDGTSPGSDGADMMTDSRQLSVFVRGKIRSPSGVAEMASRFDLGVAHSKTSLRGRTLEEISPLFRMRVELLLGRPTLAASLHFSYTMVGGADDFAPYHPPALGGLGFGAGVVHRF